MQNNISVVSFKSQNVRVQTVNHEPFFCLKDVAEILEIKDTKAKNFNLNRRVVETFPLLTNGGIQQTNFINEPNLLGLKFQAGLTILPTYKARTVGATQCNNV